MLHPTEQQIALVQGSFALVAPIADVAADLFYQRLFELDPSLRRLFKADLAEQKRKLMATLKFAVGSITRLETLLPAVAALGERHANYGVRPEHYETVAAALLWTLEKGLGDAFTPEVKTAWVAVYTLLAAAMQAAATDTRPDALAAD